MSDKTEADDFDDEDVDDILEADEDVDLDRVNKDLDLAKRRARVAGDPAWRRLERLREDKRFAELVSDFEDYDLDDTMTLRQ
jgi:hypothetical protein